MSEEQAPEVTLPNISKDLRKFYRWWWWMAHLPIEEAPRTLRREGICAALTWYFNNDVDWSEKRFYRVYREQRRLLRSMYGTTTFPFDDSSDAYCRDGATHLNPRRRAHVRQFL